MAIIYLDVPDNFGTEAEDLANAIERLLNERRAKKDALWAIIRLVEKEYMRLADLKTREELLEKAQSVLSEIYNTLRKEIT